MTEPSKLKNSRETKRRVCKHPLFLFPFYLLPAFCGHFLWHSIAVHMPESEIPLSVIKNFLGHSSIEVTMIYETVSNEVKKYPKKNGIASILAMEGKKEFKTRPCYPGLDFSGQDNSDSTSRWTLLLFSFVSLDFTNSAG